MKCKNPVKLNVRNGYSLPMRCGQCVECRLHLQACWTARLLLERQSNEFASLVTLTYDSEKMMPVLLKCHFQDFLKRLRQNFPGRIRYFCVGEYGKLNGRAHWHLILFGVDRSLKDLLQVSWENGYVDTGYTDLNYASCRYFSKYLMDKEKFQNRGSENVPVMISRNPGIGSETIWKFGRKAAVTGLRLTEIPWEYVVGGRKLPLDRTMRGWFLRGLESAAGHVPANRHPINVDSMGRLCVKAGIPLTWSNLDVVRRFFSEPEEKPKGRKYQKKRVKVGDASDRKEKLHPVKSEVSEEKEIQVPF